MKIFKSKTINISSVININRKRAFSSRMNKIQMSHSSENFDFKKCDCMKYIEMALYKIQQRVQIVENAAIH